MCVRCLGFVLLVWFPTVLHAQSATQSCSPPSLKGGYFVPEQEIYPHETTLIYACDDGQKPAVEGWWATSTCENGRWSPKPQCIDEKACFPPTVSNAEYPEDVNGGYEDGSTITITCDEGYEHRDGNDNAICRNGAWQSLPVCERSVRACSEPPPHIRHAVIIQKYQEVFAADAEVQYECEVGFTAEGGRKSIYCRNGSWTAAPTCIRETRPGAGQPAGQGPPTSSGSRETEPHFTTIKTCGGFPRVQYGEVVETNLMFLKYRCNSFYKREGPEIVRCYSNGTWSQPPTCKVNYCYLNTLAYSQLKPVGDIFIKEGEEMEVECVRLQRYWSDHYATVTCINGILLSTKCCGWSERNLGLC